MTRTVNGGFSEREHPLARALEHWEEDHGQGYHNALYNGWFLNLIPQPPRRSSLREERTEDVWWTSTSLDYAKEPKLELEIDMNAWPLMSEVTTKKPGRVIHPFRITVDQPSDEQRDEMFGGMSLREYKGDLVDKIEEALRKRKLVRDPDVPVKVTIPESFYEPVEIRVNVRTTRNKKLEDVVWHLRKAVLESFKELGEEWQLQWADPATLR